MRISHLLRAGLARIARRTRSAPHITQLSQHEPQWLVAAICVTVLVTIIHAVLS